ncbi:hypothetical protein GCM10020255_092080 [Rhodococcus baikonurensis]
MDRAMRELTMKRALVAMLIPAAIVLSSCSRAESDQDGSKQALLVDSSNFASCAEAREVGAAPLLKGEQSYRAEWDRDGDGVACETDGGAKVTTTAAPAPVEETQDSGMNGILVPGTARNRKQISSNSVSFDLSGMDLDDAAKWMGSRLPVNSDVDGMKPCDVRRFDDLYEWFWAGEVTASGVDMFSVAVLNTTPVSVVIRNAPSEPAGC